MRYLKDPRVALPQGAPGPVEARGPKQPAAGRDLSPAVHTSWPPVLHNSRGATRTDHTESPLQACLHIEGPGF